MDEGKVKPGIYTTTLIQEVCPCNYQVKIPPLSHQKSKYMRGIKYYADQLMTAITKVLHQKFENFSLHVNRQASQPSSSATDVIVISTNPVDMD